MPIWYPDRGDVEIVAIELAAKWFPKTESEQPVLFGLLKGPEGVASLESALGIIRQPYYRTVHDKAAALMRSMIKNHPFVDGNKRIGAITTIDFLSMNAHILYPSDDELVEMALAIAKSEPDMGWQEIRSWITRHCYCSKSKSQRMRDRVNSHPQDVTRRLAKMEQVLKGLGVDV